MLDIPTLKEKIKNDFWMMTFSFMIVIYMIMATVIYVLEKNEIYVALIFLGFTVFSIIAAIARNNIINNYFTSGMIVTATIKDIKKHSRYPYFKVLYKISNADFEKKIYISRVGKSRNYSKGDQIRILLDPDNPKKAIILSFYES